MKHVERSGNEVIQEELLNGLTRRQRTFILEKLMGMNDKDAALLVGYTLTVSENTKQKIWKPYVRAEFTRLSEKFQMKVHLALLRKLGAEEGNFVGDQTISKRPREVLRLSRRSTC